jgi:hypothetical protein
MPYSQWYVYRRWSARQMLAASSEGCPHSLGYTGEEMSLGERNNEGQGLKYNIEDNAKY